MVLASYGFKRYQPLEALLWKARICIWKNLARKLQEKHILIDSDLDFHQQKLVFFSHTWLSYLGFSRVTVTIDSLPTMQQFTYLRMKLAWPERPSFANWKEQRHDIKDEGIFVYNIPPWILQDFLKFVLQTTTKNRPPGWKLILLEGLNQPFTGLSSPRLTRTCLDLLSNHYLW